MNVSTELAVVITVSEAEVDIAHHSGLVIPHPSADRMILWAPSGSFDDLPTDSEDITFCTVTKYTRKRLRNGGARYTHDPDYHITFQLEEDEDGTTDD